MSNYGSNYRDQKSGSKIRGIFIAALLSFIAGGILTVWAAQRLEIFDGAKKAGANEHAGAEPAFESLTPSATQTNSEPNAAQAATGNPAPAGGILAPFAARRAINNGAPLGDIAGQLQSRFGASRPDDVATIIRLAKSPVTLDLLRAELDAQGDDWLAPDGPGGWEFFQKELRTLFVLRKADAPSPAPTSRLERARLFTEIGNIKAAIGEVRKLPGAGLADGWLKRADSYVALRGALDNIEAAALVQRAETAKPKAPEMVSPVEKPEVQTEAITDAPAADEAPE